MSKRRQAVICQGTNDGLVYCRIYASLDFDELKLYVRTLNSNFSTPWWNYFTAYCASQEICTRFAPWSVLNSTFCLIRVPFYQYGLTLITAWIVNYMPNKVLDEITYPFSNFNGCAVEAREWINNFIQHVMINYNSSMLGIKLNHVSNSGPWGPFDERFFHRNSSSIELSFCTHPAKSDCYRISHLARQQCCCGMCKIL